MPRLLSLMTVFTLAPLATAGDLTPSYFDGCKSADGRYLVTASTIGGEKNGKPIKWQIHWEDTKTQEKKTFPAPELCAGKTKGNLFVPPGGETIAVWDHIMIYTPENGGIHPHLTTTDAKSPEWKTQPEFGRRLVIYKKDGTLLKQVGINDILTADEWPGVTTGFNRVNWLTEYPGLAYKKTPRPAYAWYQISPDYSVLEFQPIKPKGSKSPARVVRVDLTTGEVIPAETKLTGDRLPGRPFKGPAELPAGSTYTPSLDPVREEGKVETKK